MTLREQLHRLVDSLPEEQLQKLRELLERLSQYDEEPLGPETLAAIEEGLEDIRRRNTMSVDEYPTHSRC